MSVSALSASTAGAPPPAEQQLGHGGSSAGGSKFAAFVSALEHEELQANAHPAATAQGEIAPTDSAAKSSASPSIDSGLAGLVFGALGSSAGVGLSRASGGRAAGGDSDRSVDDSATAASTTQQGAETNVTLAGLAYAGLGSLATAAQQSASKLATMGAPASLSAGGWRASGASSAAAPTVEKGGGASLALAGGADATLTAQSLASGVTSLGLTAIRSRTYLGVDSAARSEAKNPVWRSQARFAATALAGSETAASAGADDAAAATTRRETWGEKRSGSSGAGAPHAAGSDPSVGLAASSSAAVSGDAAAAIGAGAIAVDQLPDRLAEEASALTAPTTPAASTSAGASGQAVKELQIDLDPAHLGSVSVKMRLAEGQLSVVVEVAQPSTLKAIEGERSAIADRLGLSAQSIEILIAKPTAASQTGAESNNASDQKSGSQDNAQGDPNRPSQGNDQQASRRENAANRWNRQASTSSSTARRGFGDLLV